MGKDLEMIGRDVGGTVAQVVLRWLVQQDISVIPRASSLMHVKENAAAGDVSNLDPAQTNRVLEAVKILLRSEAFAKEEKKPDTGVRQVIFLNNLAEDVKMFWLNDANAEVAVGHAP